MSQMKPRAIVSILCLCIGTCLANASPVSPTDSHIRYVGRFDLRDPAGPRCSWPASEVQVAFRGTDIRATIRDSGQDRFQVVVDGAPTQVLKLEHGDVRYDVATGLPPGPHIVELIKRTEAFPGTAQLLGLDVAGSLMHVRQPKHVLEVIGDSISCGYGNEGKSQEEHFTVDTENAYLSYGAIAARQLKADFVDIAWSGRKMWPDNTIPEIYDLALPPDPASTWDLTVDPPGAILINLATNDFGKANPDEKGWTEAYAAFIERLRRIAPHAMVYCATGPMMTDHWPPGMNALTTLKRYLDEVVAMRAAAGDTKVKIIEFETQNQQRDGIGSDWHPNVTTHQNMAARLVKTIQADLGW